MNELLTYSRLSSFRACPRRHFLRYEVGITPEEDALALRVGSAFHAAHEAADRGQDVEAAIHARADLDAYDMALVAAMFVIHQERWAGDTLEVVATELAFDLPLLNPSTGKPTPTWRRAGCIDRIYRTPDGHLALLERKTTTEDIAPGSDLWLRYQLDQQPSIYLMAARDLGYDVQRIIYDVTVRPLLRPRMATPADKIRMRADGVPYASTRLQDETPEEFAVRIANAMRDDHDRYFARHEVSRLDQDLDNLRAEIWWQQVQIRTMQRNGRWWRNPAACLSPYRCPYLAVCDSHIDKDHVPSGFRLLTDRHPELARPGQAGQGD